MKKHVTFQSFNLYLLLSHYLPDNGLSIQEREMKDMIPILYEHQF